uniref:Uncharacterized protein n=1 Tax=Solanum lycopersicum TaxID=4081 RepID=A0A3Q7J421_SOLLC
MANFTKEEIDIVVVGLPYIPHKISTPKYFKPKFNTCIEAFTSGKIELYASDFLILDTRENIKGYIPKMVGVEKFKAGNYGMEIVFDLSNYENHTSVVFRSPIVSLSFYFYKVYNVSQSWKGENGLYCVGFSKRGIDGISMDAITIADDIKTVRMQDLITLHIKWGNFYLRVGDVVVEMFECTWNQKVIASF